MAIQTVWSVDLGKSSLKAAKLRRAQGNVEIIAIDKVDYPLSANGADPQAQAREALAVFAKRNAVREPVAVSHPGQGTFSRFIKVPAFDEKKVTEMVGHEAAQQIPFPLDEVSWDFHVIERDYLPGEEREVAIFAVRREQIDDFILEFTSHELAVETVSIGYLGLLNFVQHDIAPEEPSIVLDIGATHTDLVLVDGKRFWIRPLPPSGNDITRAIQERFKLGFAEAEKLKLETAKVPDRAVRIFQTVIQPTLKELVGEIHRSIGFYRSQHGEVNFTRLYLLGNGSKVIGIKKFLEESLNVRVERVQSINHFRVSRDVNLKLLQAHLPAFAATLGCGLQALGLAPCKVDLVPTEEKLAKEVGRKKKHVFFAAGIVFVAMFVSSWLIDGINTDAKKADQDAKLEMRELEEGKGVLDERAAQKELFETIVKDLKKLAVMRGRVLAALQALDAVLLSYPENSADIAELVKDTEQSAAADRIKAAMENSLRKRVWIPRMELARTTHTFPLSEEDSEAAAAEKRAGAGRDAAARKGPEPVPAYEFTIQVMKTKPTTQEEFVKFVRDELARKLEDEFKNRGLAVAPVALEGGSESHPFRIGSSTTDHERIFQVASGGQSRASGSGGSEEGAQEGRPFDSVDLTWTLVEKLPDVAPKSAEDAEPAGGGEPAGEAEGTGEGRAGAAGDGNAAEDSTGAAGGSEGERAPQSAPVEGATEGDAPGEGPGN